MRTPTPYAPRASRGRNLTGERSSLVLAEPAAGLALSLGHLVMVHLAAEFAAIDLGFGRTAHGSEIEQHMRRHIVERRAALTGRIQQAQPEKLVTGGICPRQRQAQRRVGLGDPLHHSPLLVSGSRFAINDHRKAWFVEYGVKPTG